MDQTTATPPAADKAGIDVESFRKQIEAVVASAIKPVTDAVAAVKADQKVLADTIAAQKPLSLDDVTKALDAREAAAKQKAEADAKAAEAAGANKAKREAFAAEKLKGVPARYHDALGEDEAKWPEQEKAIREQFAADMKAAGIQVANVGGSAGGSAPGSTAAATGGGAGLTEGQAAYAKSLAVQQGNLAK